MPPKRAKIKVDGVVFDRQSTRTVEKPNIVNLYPAFFLTLSTNVHYNRGDATHERALSEDTEFLRRLFVEFGENIERFVERPPGCAIHEGKIDFAVEYANSTGLHGHVRIDLETDRCKVKGQPIRINLPEARRWFEESLGVRPYLNVQRIASSLIGDKYIGKQARK